MFHVEHCGKAQNHSAEAADSNARVLVPEILQGVRLWKEHLLSRTLNIYESRLDLDAAGQDRIEVRRSLINFLASNSPARLSSRRPEFEPSRRKKSK
jgi:hypothetical protein